MFAERLRAVPRWIVRHPFLVIAIALSLAVLGVTQALKLRIDTNIATLLPPEYQSVRALNKLQQTVGAETTVDVAIASPSFEASRAFAEDFIPRMMALEGQAGNPYFSRYDFRRDVRFVTENALYFATFEELDRLEAFLRQTAQQVRTTTDPLRMDLFVGGAEQTARERQREQDELRADLAQLALTEYITSPDSTTLVVKFYPTGSKTDIGFVEQLYADVDALVIPDAAGTVPPRDGSNAGGADSETVRRGPFDHVGRPQLVRRWCALGDPRRRPVLPIQVRPSADWRQARVARCAE